MVVTQVDTQGKFIKLSTSDVCTFLCVYVSLRVYACVRVHVYVRMCTCLYARVCVCIFYLNKSQLCLPPLNRNVLLLPGKQEGSGRWVWLAGGLDPTSAPQPPKVRGPGVLA